MEQLQLVCLVLGTQYIHRAAPRRRVKGMVDISAGKKEGLCGQASLARELGKTESSVLLRLKK